MRRLLLGLLALGAGVLLGLLVAGRLGGLSERDPDVQSLAAAHLEAAQAQNRLTAFAARFTVAITSQQTRLGLTARKTMIVPGTVRYELDWSRLQADDLRWDAGTRTLTVDIPDISISNPEVDMARIREYRDGELLMTLTNAEAMLDSANRGHVRQALQREARAPILIRMARDATRAAVQRTFALPLAAAGIEAKVRVRFPDEAGAGM